MEYKKEEIKDYFDSYINENKTFLKENYPTTWLDDLHHNAFNSDYYIIGTYRAKLWLDDMVFDVIEHIREYEDMHFGEVTTDFSSPERVVNMYVYIIGEEIVSDYVNQLEEVA
tara:strand:- start:595 stop:933 length:339 start_codon:yes stop_codon:yes gene_type:complete